MIHARVGRAGRKGVYGTKHWSLRSLQVKLIKMGGRLVRHARRLVFQLAEVAVPREVFRQVLERVGGLHPAPG